MNKMTMNAKVKIGLAVILMGILAKLLFGGGADKEADIPELIKSGALLIDARTPGEFAGGHIEGAINIPHNTVAREIQNHETDKTKSIIVYCQSGGRSAAAKKALESAGYTNVVNGGSLHRMRTVLGQ
jgi:rhodanese-related sulfurtransferase